MERFISIEFGKLVPNSELAGRSNCWRSGALSSWTHAPFPEWLVLPAADRAFTELCKYSSEPLESRSQVPALKYCCTGKGTFKHTDNQEFKQLLSSSADFLCYRNALQICTWVFRIIIFSILKLRAWGFGRLTSVAGQMVQQLKAGLPGVLGWIHSTHIAAHNCL